MAWFPGDATPRPSSSSGAAAIAVAGYGGGGRSTADAAAACEQCGLGGADLRCSSCGSLYCSLECQRIHWPAHKASCRQKRRAASQTAGGVSSASYINAPACSSSVGVPACETDLLAEFDAGAVAGNWQSYLAKRGVARTEVEPLQRRECFALSVLQALTQLPTAWSRATLRSGRCVVWVLGARDNVEKGQIAAGGWEPLFEAVPVAWDVVLIGPELQKDNQVMISPGRRIFTFAHYLHEASLPTNLQDPSFVIAFDSGLGNKVPHQMRGWMPTVGQLLLIGRPVLLTCFGWHEARVEAMLLQGVHARFTVHSEGGFPYVLEPDKPLARCNSMFTWFCGSTLSTTQLATHAVPFIERQLRSIELLSFLKCANPFVALLSDPEGRGHAAWAEMYGEAMPPALKRSLDEDEDGHGGLQWIVLSMGAVLASACQISEAASVMRDLLGVADDGSCKILREFRSWAQAGHWATQQGLVDSVLTRIDEIVGSVAADLSGRTNVTKEEECHSHAASNVHDDFDEMAPGYNGEESVVCQCLVCGESSTNVCLRARPCSAAAPQCSLTARRTVQVRARRGLWFHVVDGPLEGWLLGYEGGRCRLEVISWELAQWTP